MFRAICLASQLLFKFRLPPGQSIVDILTKTDQFEENVLHYNMHGVKYIQKYSKYWRQYSFCHCQPLSLLQDPMTFGTSGLSTSSKSKHMDFPVIFPFPTTKLEDYENKIVCHFMLHSSLGNPPSSCNTNSMHLVKQFVCHPSPNVQ